MQISTYLMKVRVFFTRKKIIWTVIIVLILFLGWVFFGRKTTSVNIQTATVKRQDIEKTVLTTGQVVSSTDLSLSFQSSGVVRRVNVKEGDKVYQGQVLASLDQSNALAGLESAKGSLAQAQANYDKIKAGAGSEDIAVSRTSLENAKQDLLNELSDAYSNTNVAVLTYTNYLFSNPQSNSPQFGITGTVQTDSQTMSNINSDKLKVNLTLSTWQAELNTVTEANIDQIAASSLDHLSVVNSYLNNIVNVLSNYTQVSSSAGQTNLSSALSGVSTAKSTVNTASTAIVTDIQAVKTAKASFALKQAPARPEDLGVAAAQVLSAQGSVHSAQALLGNTMIIAPTSGTITLVSVKLGEQAVATKEAMKLLNVDQLHTEAQVSEADIASVIVGQTIDNTFDALGPDKHFQSKVLTVNPASTIVSGVVNYKVTGSLENIPEVKPGMTANMTIMVANKSDVLTAPGSSIVNKDGKKFVKVVDDPKKKTYHEVEVTTNLEADGGQTEIISGLSEGQEIVTYIK